jgi:hypothetical protein
MKFVLKIILSLFFILFFLTLVMSATFKFQLLKTDFWENTFTANGTYSALSQAVINNLESSAIAGGGRKSDVAVFTDLATTDNLKDLIDRNIENFLGYVNGKSVEMNVYIPVNRIPKYLLPTGLGNTGGQISFQEFLKETGIASVSASQIQKIQIIPNIVNIAFFASIFLLAVILFAYFKLTGRGKRFGFAGSALILAGIITFTGAKLLVVLRNGLIQDLLHRTDLAGVITGTMTPPLITAISKVWIRDAIPAIIFGIILFFVKEPYIKG